MKILFVTTISNTVNAFLVPHIEKLVSEGHTVEVAFNIVQEVKQEVHDLGCKVNEIPFSRSPLNSKNLIAYKMLKMLITKEKYDVVHTHTPIASMISRLVCRNLKNIKVIYTAHGFHFYKGAPLINWLIYYPIEKILSRYTDILITINHEDFDRAKRKFKAKEVLYVPGVGINLESYNQLKVSKKDKLNELGLSSDSFLLLSVGELNRNKNHEVVIKAIKQLSDPKIQYLICGEGILYEYLKKLSLKLGVSEQVHFLGYRSDVPEICKISDVFVFPSFREGLSVALMEAMATGLPVVCSNIRGNSDLIFNNQGGCLVNPRKIHQFSNCLNKLFLDEQLRFKASQFNLDKIKDFSDIKVRDKLEKLYSIEYIKGKH